MATVSTPATMKKVIVITGGASGIGKATAILFAKHNYSVVIGDMNEILANQVVGALVEGGADALFVKTDVCIENEVKNLITKAISTYGRIDAVFNSAGIFPSSLPLHQCSMDFYEKVMQVNLKGTFMVMKYAVEQMLKQGGGGCIVNMASKAGLVGYAGSCLYTASKHAVGLTKSAAKDYKSDNIRVNALCPGWVDTPMVEGWRKGVQVKENLPELPSLSSLGGRVGTAEEVAEAVLWLCSPASALVSGTTLTMDGADD